MKLYRYFYDIKEPFTKITDINGSCVQEYVEFINNKSLATKSYNEEYIKKRIATEEKMRKQFIAKGGKPETKHPNYMVLENCDYWFYNEKNVFASMAFDLNLFPKEVVSFTYGDSIPTFDNRFFDGKEYRNQIYTVDEIKKLIDKYSLPQLWNPDGKYGPENYIEVQIWSNEFLKDYNIKETKNIFKTANLFFDKIVEGNGAMKSCLENFPMQGSLEKILDINIDYIYRLYDKVKKLYVKDKMHGIEHAFRCAIYMLLIGQMAKVGEQFLEIMIISALAHDIGRKYSRTEEHGLMSAQILPQLFNINNNYMKIAQTAITVHSIENVNVYMNIKPMTKEEKQLILWLKDIDTLDHIRFGVRGYNPSLLSTIEAKKLVKLAAQLNLYMYLYPNDDFKLLKGKKQ